LRLLRTQKKSTDSKVVAEVESGERWREKQGEIKRKNGGKQKNDNTSREERGFEKGSSEHGGDEVKDFA
jgi:hypothetical protein